MGRLFHVGEDAVRALEPTSFGSSHREEDLQRLADANPHLLNQGLPMLSLVLDCEDLGLTFRVPRALLVQSTNTIPAQSRGAEHLIRDRLTQNGVV